MKKKRDFSKEFIQKAITKHGDLFNYDSVIYVNKSTLVNIKCTRCDNIFSATPTTHLRYIGGHKCKMAVKVPKKQKKARTKNEMIEILKKNDGKYEYNFNKIGTILSKIRVFCIEHQFSFSIVLRKHLLGQTSCIECIEYNKKVYNENNSKEILMKNIEKAKIVHNNFYDYSLFNTINTQHKGIIICPKHGSFEMDIHDHLYGSGCNGCKLKTETRLKKFLESNFKDVQYQQGFSWCPGNKRLCKFDFVIGNVIIELDGVQHFKQVSDWKTPEYHRERDLYKMHCANNNGYKIFRIYQELYWNNPESYNLYIINTINKMQNEGEIINYYDTDCKYYDCMKDDYEIYKLSKINLCEIQVGLR